jgi:hypothetical protein
MLFNSRYILNNIILKTPNYLIIESIIRRELIIITITSLGKLVNLFKLDLNNYLFLDISF